MFGAYASAVRILVVSQMYPGPDAPDLGTFVAQVERALVARGHEVDLAVLDTRAGGKLRYATLARRTLAASKPDVVYAHFLVPAGLIAALAAVRETARGDANLLPPMRDALRARCTVGEICETLREEWGMYDSLRARARA